MKIENNVVYRKAELAEKATEVYIEALYDNMYEDDFAYLKDLEKTLAKLQNDLHKARLEYDKNR